MSEHNLKIAPVYFDAVADGSKTVELRKDDRGYDVDDTLVLREFQPAHWCHGEWIDAHYTGRECRAVVTHITTGDDWLQPGIVALSIQTEDSARRLEALERLYTASQSWLAFHTGGEEAFDHINDSEALMAHIYEMKRREKVIQQVVNDLTELSRKGVENDD